MISINSDHEEIAKYIVKAIADDHTHSVEQQIFRQHFTNPYRLHEYDLSLKILKDFDVIRQNQNGRLAPGNLFYTYKNLKTLYKTKTDWKFWVATVIAVFGVVTSFYISHNDRQKSATIDKLERTNKEIMVTNDSLVTRVIFLDSVNQAEKLERTDTTTKIK